MDVLLRFTELFSTLPYLETVLLGNTVGQYILATVLFIGLFIAVVFVDRMLLGHFERLSKRTRAVIDDTFVEILKIPKPKFFIMLAFYLATTVLTIHSFVAILLRAVILIWAVYYVVQAAEVVVRYMMARVYGTIEPAERGAIDFLSKIIKFTLWTLGLLLVLSNLGINITSLIAGLGIGGIAIAFALQKILGDLFSSFAIHFDKPFKVGDFIMLDANTRGTVEKIGIKTTRVRAFQGEELVIPNNELTSSRIQNFRTMKERRVKFKFGVTYETTSAKLEKIPSIIEKVIGGVKDVRLDRVHFTAFDDFALTFSVVYYVESNEFMVYLDRQQEILFQTKRALEKAGIEMAYPTQTLYVHKARA